MSRSWPNISSVAALHGVSGSDSAVVKDASVPVQCLGQV